jgi:serine/threonine-protein phosphatase 2A regulatory subunit B''
MSRMDLIRPVIPNQIRLSDLKKSKCAPMFFDMLFDLRKYDGHIRRIDPMFREMDEVYVDGIDGVRVKLE